MILLEDDAIGDTLSYAVDECLNFTKMEAFDASNVYDEVIIEIRKKSYAISSEHVLNILNTIRMRDSIKLA